MTSTAQERKLLADMFRSSWQRTTFYKSGQTCFSEALATVHFEDYALAIYKKIEINGIEYQKQIGCVQGSQIINNHEILIDRLEDIRELIHTRQTTHYKGWRRLFLWPTDRFKKILQPFDRQFGDIVENQTDLNIKLMDQILKGLISEL